MRAAMGAMLLFIVGLGPVTGQERKFPYEAVIDVDEEFVRCGPGPKYYPTGKVTRGSRITVHRHDPGGWAMIAPPPESFSWIQAEYVQKGASGKGALTANNVIVHVGSSLGDDRGVYQRTLSKGDSVEVLGEQLFVTERGPVKMYKIKPPPREYRWIAGKALVPANGAAPPNRAIPKGPDKPIPFIQGPVAKELETSVAAENDAFAPSPFDPAAEQDAALMPLDEPPVVAGTDEPRPAGPPPEPGSLEALRLELAALDEQFRGMLQAEPNTWDLAALKSAYTGLETQAQHPAFTSHVQQRLATIQRYGKIQQDFVEFYRLTSETKQRDAQLSSLQKAQETQLKLLQSAGVAPPVAPASTGQPRMENGPPSVSPTPVADPNAAAGGVPMTEAGTSTGPTPPPNVAAPAATPSQTKPASRFSGAGIVQKSSIPAPGVPPYMLIAPDGRLLAYLEPADGVDLDQVENQALGIVGERSHREALKTDVIIVRGYQPVILRSTQR